MKKLHAPFQENFMLDTCLKSLCNQQFYPLKLIFDYQNCLFQCFFPVKKKILHVLK